MLIEKIFWLSNKKLDKDKQIFIYNLLVQADQFRSLIVDKKLAATKHIALIFTNIHQKNKKRLFSSLKNVKNP